MQFQLSFISSSYSLEEIIIFLRIFLVYRCIFGDKLDNKLFVFEMVRVWNTGNQIHCFSSPLYPFSCRAPREWVRCLWDSPVCYLPEKGIIRSALFPRWEFAPSYSFIQGVPKISSKSYIFQLNRRIDPSHILIRFLN